MIKRIQKNLEQILILLVFIIFSAVLFIKNFCTDKFWEASLIDIITVFVGIFITFLLGENINNIRRRNDCIEHIILEIEDMVVNGTIFSSDRSITLMKQASCANRIKYLKDANFSDFQDDFNFIDAQFQEIRELYANHEDNLNDVKKIL